MNVSAVSERITLSEFDLRFGEEKPYYEYWHGEPVQKSMPTWIHGYLQRILLELLTEQGYLAGSEVRLKIDLELQLLPDVIATKQRPELPYPTRAVEIVVEILSPGDSRERLRTKCEAYAQWGFEQIYVVDPDNRQLLAWRNGFMETTTFVNNVPASQIWDRLNRILGN